MSHENAFKFNQLPSEHQPSDSPEKKEVEVINLTEITAEYLENIAEINKRLDDLLKLIGAEEDDKNSLKTNHLGSENREIEAFSFQTVWKVIKDKLIDISPDFIINEDEFIVKYVEQMENSAEIGKAASRLFNYLVKHGLRNTDLEYEYVEKNNRFPKFAEKELETAQKIKESEDVESDSKSEKINLLKSVFNRRFENEPANYDDLEIGNFLTESYTEKTEQAGGENVIEESVFNRIFEKGNKAYAYLLVHNNKSGMTLDLNELIPSDYNLAPSDMLKIKSEIVLNDKGEKTVEKKFIPSSLKNYKKSAEDKFFEAAGAKYICYGKLDKKGGLISLLHEIAHSWQSKHISGTAKSDFENFYFYISGVLELLYNASLDNDMIRYEKCKEILAKVGVEVDEKVFDFEQNTAENTHEVSLYDYIEKKETIEKKLKIKAVVKSETIKKVVENYVSEERSAWAHAIRVLRFLRQSGIDLEPELKTLSDFKEIIDNCLGTYQDNIDQRIVASDNTRKFTRKVN